MVTDEMSNFKTVVLESMGDVTVTTSTSSILYLGGVDEMKDNIYIYTYGMRFRK